MVFIIQLIGVVLLLLAIWIAVRPDIVRTMMNFVKVDKRIYLAGVVRLLAGVIFLLSATNCRVPWMIAAFGILFIASGVLVFALKQKKILSIIDVWLKKSDTDIRFLSALVFIVAFVIIRCA